MPVPFNQAIRSKVCPRWILLSLVKKTNEIMDTTNLALKSFTVATANIEAITGKVNRGEGTMGALINDPKIYNELSTVASEAHKTVTEANMGATALQENMQALKQNWLFRGFFKNRGYQDATELTKHAIPELPGQPPSQAFTFDAKDLFNKSNTAKLRNEKSLNRVGEFLETNPFGLVVVTASEGLAGDSEEDLVLSQARAMVVRQYLVEKFKLDDTRLKTKGFGKRAAWARRESRSGPDSNLSDKRKNSCKQNRRASAKLVCFREAAGQKPDPRCRA